MRITLPRAQIAPSAAPAPIPAPMVGWALEPHQIPARDYLRARRMKGKGGALYMRMRLGKTVVMCDYMTKENPRDTVLVVCPKNVTHVWKDMLKVYGVRNVVILDGDKQKRVDQIESIPARWYIVNYEMVEKLQIHTYNFDTLIIDESIKIANHRSKISEYCFKYARIIPYIYLLAGDPSPENKMQLFMQMLIMQGSFLGKNNYYSILSTYYEPIGFDHMPKPDTIEKIDAALHSDCFVLTRSQAGFTDKTVRQTRQVKMRPEQLRAYREMLETFEVDGLQTELHLVQAGYLQQIAGGFNPATKEWLSEDKIDDVKYLLKTELKKEQVLIWCSHTHEVDKLEEELRSVGIYAATITGEVNVDLREEIRLRFSSQKIRVVIATIDSIYQGGNWSSGSVCIFLSNVFSYNKRSQAQDRIYNIKKDVPLLVIDMVTEDSVEVGILDILNEKHIESHFTMSNVRALLKAEKDRLEESKKKKGSK